MPTPPLIIFDFDGTLFNTHASIRETIRLTFASLLPTSPPPPDSEIEAQIASGAGLADTFRALHAAAVSSSSSSLPSAEFESWVSKYREIYAERGQDLVTAYPGAKTLLETVQKKGIPMSIISNKGVEAVRTALANNGLVGFIPEEFIIGDKTPGAKRKPDVGSFEDVLLPRLREKGVDVDAGGRRRDVLVVGDTVADIGFARNLGCRVCWCRFGYGGREECEGLRPDWVVDGLAEVVSILEE
ncbi:HAD-like domain-containing protein [Aspergillus pseudodeflectus]|uniref:HAD-like domain-containing protein n=1 Tax=Aspergillus pseudodeflectus TaxID=176178 RepID=A0ABR4L4M3_9EURO